MGNLVHLNTVTLITFIQRLMDCQCDINVLQAKGYYDKKIIDHFATILYYALFQDKISKIGYDNMREALLLLERYPLFKQEVAELMTFLKDNLEFQTYQMGNNYPFGLELYGCYTREEIFALFDRQTCKKKMQGVAAGVFNIEEQNTELLFVTLNKSDKDFSPSTQYNDFFISENRFHWQSQNTMSHSNAGKRYVNQRDNGRRFILFVREDKKDGYGNTSPYYCMGLIDYLSSHGDFPMNIEWQMEKPALAKFIKAV